MKLIAVDLRTLRVCEPEKTRFVLRFAYLSPLVVLGSLVLGVLTSIVLAAGLIVVYVLVLAFLFWDLSQSVSRILALMDETAVPQPSASPHQRNTDESDLRTQAILGIKRWQSSIGILQGRFGGQIRVATFAVIVLALAGLAAVFVLGKGSAQEAKAQATIVEPRQGVDDIQSVVQDFTVAGSAGPLSSRSGMLNTSIVLKPGSPVSLDATGVVSCVSSFSWCTVGPGGEPRTPASSGFPAPGAPAWGLVAQVGRGPVTFIGAAGSITGDGVLKLGVNDNYPNDNTGSFVVTVKFECSLSGAKGHNACPSDDKP